MSETTEPPRLAYPDFKGNKDAEIIWLQGQVTRLARENSWHWDLRRLRYNVDEAVIELSLLRKAISEEAMERVRALEIELARVLSRGAQSTGQEVVFERAKLVLGEFLQQRRADTEKVAGELAKEWTETPAEKIPVQAQPYPNGRWAPKARGGA